MPDSEGRTTVSVPKIETGTAPWSVQTSGYTSDRRDDLPIPDSENLPDKMLSLSSNTTQEENIINIGDRK